MRYLNLGELLELHLCLAETHGRRETVDALDVLEVSLAAPKAHYNGRELRRTLSAKVAALTVWLAANGDVHGAPVALAHAAMEVMLLLNGLEIAAPIEEQEGIMKAVAARTIDEKEFESWLNAHVVEYRSERQPVKG
jgi:death-on-curing protein